jgi:hypothetical protein
VSGDGAGAIVLFASARRDQARRLRGKTGSVVCTSIYDEPQKSFIAAFADNFGYFGMRFGGVAHLNCRDGCDADAADREAERFAASAAQA